MKSIQQRLPTSLLIGLPLLWLLTSSFIAWRLWHEINEMNDTQITQVARYLIGVSADEEHDDDDDRGEDLDRLVVTDDVEEAVRVATGSRK